MISFILIKLLKELTVLIKFNKDLEDNKSEKPIETIKPIKIAQLVMKNVDKRCMVLTFNPATNDILNLTGVHHHKAISNCCSGPHGKF